MWKNKLPQMAKKYMKNNSKEDILPDVRKYCNDDKMTI